MVDIDSIDRKIVAILEKNSRTANTEIAKKMGISETTVRKRIKKLEIENYEIKLTSELKELINEIKEALNFQK